MGYITTEQEPNRKLKLHYTYGNQGQLLTAAKSVNDVPQKTYTCTYDTCGNIRTATDGTTSHSYTYDDSDWADLLTAYDGNALTYDASGNPTSYYNGSSYTMQWRNGRELQNLTKGGKKTNYEYDVDVLRNLKTNADGSYSVYYWRGTLLLAEDRHTSAAHLTYGVLFSEKMGIQTTPPGNCGFPGAIFRASLRRFLHCQLPQVVLVKVKTAGY